MNKISSAVSRPILYLLLARNKRGHNIAEMGPTLLLVFVIIGFPLLAFATVGMRYIFLFNAARLACTAGSVCSSFQTNVSSTNLSAVNAANQVAASAAAGFNGITLNSVTCYIVTMPLAGGSATRQTTPLTSPANPQTSSYTFEVVLNGTLKPLVESSWKYFGTVPLLTGPLTTSARYQLMFENTQHLNM